MLVFVLLESFLAVFAQLDNFCDCMPHRKDLYVYRLYVFFYLCFVSILRNGTNYDVVLETAEENTYDSHTLHTC